MGFISELVFTAAPNFYAIIVFINSKYIKLAIPGLPHCYGPYVNRFLHLPVSLRTQRHCFLSHSVLREVTSYAYLLGGGFCTHQ